MSKENNLKDYLADLYLGIASKKPGASKNPQDFRREIESIVTGGGSSLPEYDGTIIIEKANSVLGLRRFKENATAITTVDTMYDQEVNAELIENHGFEITPIVDGEYELQALSCLVNYEGTLLYCNKIRYTPDNSIIYGLTTIEDSRALYTEFEIISTANSTVDEWLLANTEPVTQENVLGLRKFKETLTSIVLSEQPSSTEYYNSNCITITPRSVETGSGATAIFYGFTPLYSVDGVIGTVADVQMGTIRITTNLTNIEGLEGQTFEILSVANDTVAEWVFANTEGVSV